MKSPRTDLAMESFGASGKSEMPGVQVSQWETGGVQLTEVVISDAGSAEELGKACGKYLTLESPLLRERDPETRMAMAALLGEGAAPEAGADLTPDADYGRFCRNCIHFIEHPFRTLCGRDGRTADPMGECGHFKRKEYLC